MFTDGDTLEDARGAARKDEEATARRAGELERELERAGELERELKSLRRIRMNGTIQLG